MKNKDLKLKMLATATAVVIGGSVVFLSPAQAVLAAEAPVAISTQAILPKMTMAQVYAGLDIRTTGEANVSVGQAAFGTTTSYFIANKIGWNLNMTNAVTLGGKPINFSFLCPDVLDSWGQQGKVISHSGGDVAPGMPAWYSLQVWPEGTTVENGLPGDIDQNLLQELIATDGGTGYADIVDEGNTIRLVYSVVREDRIGYYCIVEDKETKNTTSFQYTERADLYDDLRALTVIYSCLPQ